MPPTDFRSACIPQIQERFQEQLRLAQFGKDVGLAMCQGDNLPDMLRQCTEAMVRHLDGAFARIWTLNEADSVLELQASAGLYTHLDGAHSRVPLGQYKIGLIGQERKAHLTNAVLADPRVSDHEWARREGMVAFAGYPLLVEDCLVGVMAMFARQSLSEATLDAMASVANGITVGIERKRTQERLQRAYHALDLELKIVGDIQRTLLPANLPRIPTLDLAAFYQPSQRAGGDYYDFFPLTDNRWGLFVADVSGHGTPAAVLMAVTHCIAHTHPGPLLPPGKVLEYVNHHLSTRYTNLNGGFVTAFFGIYDSSSRRLAYASAGHDCPRLKRCQDETLLILEAARGLPLGVDAEETYHEAVQQLQKGDQIVIYTDGVTDARNPSGEMFGIRRLDRVLQASGLEASALLDRVLGSLEDFAAGHPADDDRTLIVARVR
jgi:serine phosphatase RsbU (regulator of sigma subunit)